MKSGIITKVAGPLVIAEGMRDADMFDVVRVSSQRLIGEIIEMHGDRASIQVYEETSGLGPGEIVESTGAPLSVELGPGLIGSIYDGIQRPLNEIMKVAGTNLKRGVDVPSLDHKKKWHFTPLVKKGDTVAAGDTLGTVQETHAVLHRILVPNKTGGVVESISEGDFTIDETVAVLKTDKGNVEINMCTKWPVRVGRPYKRKLSPDILLTTGQRPIDTLFPLAKGGVVAGELVFTHVGQVQRLAALFGELIFGDVTLRHEGHAAAFDAKFKNELHLQHLLHDGDSFVELRLGDELGHAPENAALDLCAAEDVLCFERVKDLLAAVGAFDLGDELVEEFTLVLQGAADLFKFRGEIVRLRGAEPRALLHALFAHRGHVNARGEGA